VTPLDRYAEFWGALTPETLPQLAALVSHNIRFKDPFNDVRGVEPMIAVMALMFRHGTPHFQVLDRALGAAADRGYLRWRCTIAHSSGAPTVLEGMSEVRFDTHGLAIEHIDHWDAAEQLYERVPMLGTVLRLIKRRFQANT
jgi:steroid Delta-isomerase